MELIKHKHHLLGIENLPPVCTVVNLLFLARVLSWGSSQLVFLRNNVYLAE